MAAPRQATAGVGGEKCPAGKGAAGVRPVGQRIRPTAVGAQARHNAVQQGALGPFFPIGEFCSAFRLTDDLVAEGTVGTGW